MKQLSRKTITRALLYIRTLQTLMRQGRYFISSADLAKFIGISDVQVRKDISNVGKVGIPRVGYNVRDLLARLENFVLKKDIVHVVIFGVGNLGTAILKFPWLGKGKIKIVAAFDTDKRKIGKIVNGTKIYPVTSAAKIIKRCHGDIGIVAVPEKWSQQVANTIIDAGLKGILNFSPVSITVPDDVYVKHVDLSITFLALYCHTKRHLNK